MNDEKMNKWKIGMDMLIHPVKTTAWLIQQNSGGWLFPVIITAVLLIGFSVVQHQMVNRQAIQNVVPMMDPMLDSSGKEVTSGVVISGGGGGGDTEVPLDENGMPIVAEPVGESTVTFLLNTIGRVLGYLGIWLILSISLHLGLMISGGNLQQRAVFSLAAWASLAIAVRCLIQILYMLISGQPVLGDGLSGMLTEKTFLSYVLGGLDIYLIWQFVLIFLGLHQANNLSKRKLAGLITVNGLLVLLLAALPPFVINSVLTAVSSSSGFLG
jgi:hypothetical protein